MSEKAAFSRVLARVEKPGRYVGGEWNEIRKDPARVRTKVALAFPDVYEIGMSYLGQKILYDLLNKDRDVLAERVFAPWPDLERELRAAGLPLASLENGLPLREFDIVGFSLLYELNFSNVLTVLDLGGIPLTSAERGEAVPARHRRRAGGVQSRTGRRHLRPRLPRRRRGGIPRDRQGCRRPAATEPAAPRAAARAGPDRRSLRPVPL